MKENLPDGTLSVARTSICTGELLSRPFEGAGEGDLEVLVPPFFLTVKLF